MRLAKKAVELIRSRILPVTETGCWLWIGATTPEGYARVSLNGKPKAVHRLLYAHHVGTIPKGFCVDHKCEVTCCVNPYHLEAVTYSENTLRFYRSRFAAVKNQSRHYGRTFMRDRKNLEYNALRTKLGLRPSVLREAVTE